MTFHDLRGTAVTRLALAECTEAEIATITGHSLRDVRAILDAHYLRRDPALGESAIRKLEMRTKHPTEYPTSQGASQGNREKRHQINGCPSWIRIEPWASPQSRRFGVFERILGLGSELGGYRVIGEGNGEGACLAFENRATGPPPFYLAGSNHG